MTISQRSRYIAANQINIIATSSALPERGNVLTIYTPPVVFLKTPYRRYQVMQGDTFTKLAQLNLGDPSMWWRIADLNPQIFHPWDLVPGIVIRMPV